MKFSRSDVRKKAHAHPELKFENQTLTSFAGLVIFQRFFATIGLKARLHSCFRHLNGGKVFCRATIFYQLILHILLGFRELQDSRYYEDDPLVQRVLGLKRLPDVATISRMLRDADERSVAYLRCHQKQMVLDRVLRVAPARITLDFDGSVQSTKRHAEGTAVGFNKKKKGARSYYPLFCTIAQTGQVLDFLHRPGNSHDSNGAKDFICACINWVRNQLPHVIIEIRMDSAFFSDDIVMALTNRGVEFTISVPFERFVKLKQTIEARTHWWRVNDQSAYFEESWKPDKWKQHFRFLFVRTETKKQRKGPIQLDLFEPQQTGYEFKVIVTNKSIAANSVVTYHEGRGSQEGVFAELKTACHMDYVPVKTLHGNQTYLMAGIFAYNLTRELQMETSTPTRQTTPTRATLWVFEKLDTIRKTLIQRAGRLSNPRGVLTLTISANHWIKQRILKTLRALPY